MSCRSKSANLFLLLYACSCLIIGLSSLSVGAQPAGYTKLNVKNRVQLEIPDGWTISDAEQRKRVKELAEKATGIPIQHTASVSVQSFPAPSRIFVRVSFLRLESPISQADVRKEVQSDRQQVIRDLGEMWKEEAPLMWTGLAKTGIKEVGRASFAVETIGGQTALVIRYARTSSVNQAETVNVAQYHIPLGDEKALITLSYINGDKDAAAAHDRLKSSVVIR